MLLKAESSTEILSLPCSTTRRDLKRASTSSRSLFDKHTILMWRLPSFINISLWVWWEERRVCRSFAYKRGHTVLLMSIQVIWTKKGGFRWVPGLAPCLLFKCCQLLYIHPLFTCYALILLCIRDKMPACFRNSGQLWGIIWTQFHVLKSGSPISQQKILTSHSALSSSSESLSSP